MRPMRLDPTLRTLEECARTVTRRVTFATLPLTRRSQIGEPPLTDNNEIEFLEAVGNPGAAPSGNGGRRSRSLPVRIGVVAGAALLVVIGAVAAMGASPSPSSTTADPGANVAPGTKPAPGTTPTGPT